MIVSLNVFWKLLALHWTLNFVGLQCFSKMHVRYEKVDIADNGKDKKILHKAKNKID